MRSRSSIALLAALAVLALDGVARADVPPPEDYVDPCKSAALDESCQRCVSPEFKNPDCHAKAREGGLVQRCQGWSYTMYPAPVSPNSCAARLVRQNSREFTGARGRS